MGWSVKPHLSKFFECKNLEKTDEEKKFEREGGKHLAKNKQPNLLKK